MFFWFGGVPPPPTGLELKLWVIFALVVCILVADYIGS